MNQSDRQIDFGEGSSIRAAGTVQLEKGAQSAEFEVKCDLDSIDILSGSGTIEIDGTRHALTEGVGFSVLRGSHYRLSAAQFDDLSVAVYSVEQDS